MVAAGALAYHADFELYSIDIGENHWNLKKSRSLSRREVPGGMRCLGCHMLLLREGSLT